MSHSVASVRQFTRDVGDGFRDAAERAGEFAKHTVKAGENILDAAGQTAKSLAGMVEYLPWLAGGALAVYAVSTLNEGKRQRVR